MVLLFGAGCSAPLLAQKGATDILADKADAVVVGEVISGQQTGRSLAFILSVIRTLKGALAPGEKLDVSGGPVALSYNGPIGAHYGIWFLKKSGTQWGLLPINQRIVTLDSSGYLPLPKADPSKIVGIMAVPATMNDKMAVEIVAGIQAYSDRRQISAMAWNLILLRQSSILPALNQSLRSNPDPEIRFVGLIGMLCEGGDKEVSALEEIANSLASSPRFSTKSILTILVSGTSTPHPGAIQPLGRIAASSDIWLQKAAASAFANIHSHEAVPFLAQFLYSTDSQVRMSAILGLSRFVENLPIATASNIPNGKSLVPQGPTPYRTVDTDKHSRLNHPIGPANEAEFVAYWKSWWVAMKDKLTTVGQ